MNRRGFLKGAAGLLSLPIVGKMASSVKSPMVREGIANVAQVASDAPIYFWKLVDKIRNLGKDVTQTAGTADRQTVKQYKDYELTEDVATGEIQIFKNSQSDQAIDRFASENANEEVFMRYKPSEKILLDEANPGGGVRKTMPEYEENTSYISNNRENTGEILEELSGVPDDIFLEVGEQVPEFLRKGKADGGIINLANGGRVGRWMGGPLSAGKSTLREMLKYFSKGSTHRKSGAELLKMVNPKQISKYLEDPNNLFMKGSSKEGIMATDMVKNYAKQVEGERSMMIGELLDAAKNIRKGDKSIDQYKQQIIKEMMDKGANREMAENLAEMLSGMAQDAGGRTPTPNITDQGLLELENIQKNLLTKGKSLNADGGRIELAKGGLPRALQLALKTIKSKFGDDAIMNANSSKRKLTKDEIEDFTEELGDTEYWMSEGTLGEAEQALKNKSEYESEMYQQYKMGKLDPEAGDKSPARKRFLEQKLADMEASGDSRLMTREEIEELTFFDMGTEMDNFGLSSAEKKGKKLADSMSDAEIDLRDEFPGIEDRLIKQILTDDNPQRVAEVKQTMREALEMQNKGMSVDEIIKIFKGTTRTKQANGGIIGLTSNPRSANNKAGVETLFKRR